MSEMTLEERLRDARDQLIGSHYGYLRDLLTAAAAALRTAEIKGGHCATCQCNKLADAENKPAPGNPKSKTWHW